MKARFAVRSALLALGLLFAPDAEAQGFLSVPDDANYLNFGLLFSATGRPSGTTMGLGGELSLHKFIPDTPIVGLGLFTQLQVTDRDHLRFAGGAQVTVLAFGLELGVAREGSNADYSATTSLHLAPFVSAGYATVGLRLGIPLASSGPQPGYGSDIGVTVALKYPFQLKQR